MSNTPRVKKPWPNRREFIETIIGKLSERTKIQEVKGDSYDYILPAHADHVSDKLRNTVDQPQPLLPADLLRIKGEYVIPNRILLEIYREAWREKMGDIPLPPMPEETKAAAAPKPAPKPAITREEIIDAVIAELKEKFPRWYSFDFHNCSNAMIADLEEFKKEETEISKPAIAALALRSPLLNPEFEQLPPETLSEFMQELDACCDRAVAKLAKEKGIVLATPKAPKMEREAFVTELGARLTIAFTNAGTRGPTSAVRDIVEALKGIKYRAGNMTLGEFQELRRTESALQTHGKKPEDQAAIAQTVAKMDAVFEALKANQVSIRSRMIAELKAAVLAEYPPKEDEFEFLPTAARQLVEALDTMPRGDGFIDLRTLHDRLNWVNVLRMPPIQDEENARAFRKRIGELREQIQTKLMAEIAPQQEAEVVEPIAEVVETAVVEAKEKITVDRKTFGTKFIERLRQVIPIESDARHPDYANSNAVSNLRNKLDARCMNKEPFSREELKALLKDNTYLNPNGPTAAARERVADCIAVIEKVYDAVAAEYVQENAVALNVGAAPAKTGWAANETPRGPDPAKLQAMLDGLCAALEKEHEFSDLEMSYRNHGASWSLQFAMRESVRRGEALTKEGVRALAEACKDLQPEEGHEHRIENFLRTLDHLYDQVSAKVGYVAPAHSGVKPAADPVEQQKLLGNTLIEKLDALYSNNPGETYDGDYLNYWVTRRVVSTLKKLAGEGTSVNRLNFASAITGAMYFECRMTNLDLEGKEVTALRQHLSNAYSEVCTELGIVERSVIP